MKDPEAALWVPLAGSVRVEDPKVPPCLGGRGWDAESAGDTWKRGVGRRHCPGWRH